VGSTPLSGVEAFMEVVHPRCAGIDLGKDELVSCIRIHENGIRQECRTFKTTVKELLALSEWMTSEGVTHVVMEATGTYWKPVWHVLEASFTLILANAAHVRGIPGRKSDVNDAMWLGDLLAHGLIRGSFIPPAPIQDLRDLTRTRKQLVREIAQHTQRIQKTLDDANIKITGLITDILGVTGRAILQALIEGETNPDRLANLARKSLKAKRSRLVEALHGWVRPHHRQLLKLHLNLIVTIEKEVEGLDQEIGDALAPFRNAAERIDGIPGIADVAAQSIIAEIGVDMSRFPTHENLISWACLCPRLDQSAGRVHSNRSRKGGLWLKTLLVQCAWAGVRVKNSYLRAQFYRIRARRGPKKAIMAVAASMLTAIYYILRDGVEYRDLGPNYLDNLNRTKLGNRLVRRLQNMGYKVEISEAA
jgi:transposase